MVLNVVTKLLVAAAGAYDPNQAASKVRLVPIRTGKNIKEQAIPKATYREQASG
jgi:hypothetical protein